MDGTRLSSTSQSDIPRQLWTIFIIVFVIIHFTLIDIINNQIGYPFCQTLVLESVSLGGSIILARALDDGDFVYIHE